jgi:alcohol dehydrogenase, propanol-preferring
MSFLQPKKAAIVVSPDAPICLKNDYSAKQPDELAPGEYLIKMHCIGVCQLIGGHEGVGEIVERTLRSGIEWASNLA